MIGLKGSTGLNETEKHRNLELYMTRQRTAGGRNVKSFFPQSLLICFFLNGMFVCPVTAESSAETETQRVPFSEQEIVTRVFSLTENYLQDFRHPQTNVLYGARLSTRKTWTSPADVKKERPKPWGYGSRIADTALHCGHLLVALLDAYEARPAPFLKENIARTFAALKLIGSLPEKYPKPGKPALSGLVPRGPHPDDITAYYDDSSMDQHTTYIISLARYANSSLASQQQKKWIRESLEKVGRRLEKNSWSIKRGDGVTQSHVGFAWTGFNSDHASILLPAVLALYHGTGDEHWLKTYEKFLAEKEGLRWKKMHPGPHVKINGHPIYANQNAFRVNALYRMEKDPARKNVLLGLLKQTAQMQMQRDFPGPFYKRFHSPEQWKRMRDELGWKDENLHGAQQAWNAFKPEMLDQGSLPVLAHVRFPLGGYHMVILSENREMISQNLADIWKMLTTVDLKKINAGETNYLFTVVALHTYAFYFQNQQLFSSADQRRGGENHYGEELPLIKDAGIGPTIDVAIASNYACAIGRGKLSVLEISNPADPQLCGELSGLGGVRQILVQDRIAYITSRQDGLFIVSLKNPRKPQLLNHYDTIEFATGVAISGDVLFVACRNYGVELIDVSNPSRPLHLSTVRTAEAQSVVARDGWLYVGDWVTSEVLAVDVHNPREPKITAHLSLDGYGDGVDLQGNYLYAATGHHSRKQPHRTKEDPGFGYGHGLEIFDLKDPAHPRFVSRLKFPRLYNIGNDMWGVTVVDNFAFVADTHNGVFVVDLTDKKQPKVVAHRKLPFVESRKLHAFVGGLDLAEDLVYIAGGETDLHIVAAPGMARPVARKQTNSPRIPPDQAVAKQNRFRIYRSPGQIHAVDFFQDRAVIACGSDGVHVVALWPTIKFLSKFKTEHFATDVALFQNKVFIAAGFDGLLIAEISESGKMTLLGKYQVKGQAIKQVEVPAPGNFALIQVGAGQFQIIDITQPASPREVLKESRLGLLYGDQMMRGLAENRFACVFWHVSGLHWYDLHAKPKPVFSGDNIPLRIGAVNGLVEYQNKTLATVRGGYILLNRQDRRPVSQIEIYRFGKRTKHPGKPTIFADRLYAANRAAGTVSVVDISEITQPKLIEQIELPGNPGRVIIHNESLIIPDGYHGLLIGNREK